MRIIDKGKDQDKRRDREKKLRTPPLVGQEGRFDPSAIMALVRLEISLQSKGKRIKDGRLEI